MVREFVIVYLGFGYAFIQRSVAVRFCRDSDYDEIPDEDKCVLAFDRAVWDRTFVALSRTRR
jgi:hypothetical protein